jgi:hypothetical protein
MGRVAVLKRDRLDWYLLSMACLHRALAGERVHDIACAASPWLAVCVPGVVLGWLRGDGVGNSTTLAVINGIALLFLFVRPALLSLRRWDEASRTL